MASILITFPDESTQKYEAGVTPLEIAQKISEGLARMCIAAQVNDKVVDTSTPIVENAKLKLLTPREAAGVDVLRHSCAHLLAHAVKRLYPQALPTIGPVIENGFYYDFDNLDITDDILPKLEEEMKKLAKEKLVVSRIEHASPAQAKEQYKDNQYKLEIITKNEEGGGVSSYNQGDFTDLCRGPHVPNTGFLEAFKLTKTARAYWRGDAANKQLTRIYGLCFAKKAELEAHIKMLEEAEKRDHRKIGRELDLIMFHEYSPGAPFFLPKGAIIYRELVAFIQEEYRKRGYQEVVTPLLYDKTLWETSGHWEHYRENMFILESEGKQFGLKPMNCPSHCLIFKNSTRSYRDLPLRIADFAPLHRNELSGTLSGLTRVRKFSQDDAHIFCTPEQLEEELRDCIDFVKHVYHDVFRMEFTLELSTRPEKFLGDIAVWNKAEATLAAVLDSLEIPYKINPGDGAFYGPKIDIHLKDAIGRSFQCATVQVDFQLPLRFELAYEGADNTKHAPVMVHRAILGSLERFFAVMVEHFAGKFPLWLSPEQVRVLPIADRHNAYAALVVKTLRDAGLRADIDDRALTTNKKVREAELSRVNYILVVGDKEVEAQTVNVRTRDNAILGEKALNDFCAMLVDEARSRRA
ncbi:TPA: threonine--tRNA ligase [Candidatus Woesearchaeota archaeon]|nr:threonine--tRNA ligase [Candidatus Woesearchaeota archaeon]